MTQEKPDLGSLFPEEIRTHLTENGIEGYRASQIVSWLNKGVRSFSEMKNLSKSLQERLEDLFVLKAMREVDFVASKLDETVKFLFTLSDGEYVESVL